MEWVCEAWTLPGSASFEIVVEVPLVEATLNENNQPWGTGSVSVPATFEHIDLVADVEPDDPGSAAFSLLRFRRPGASTYDFEFYADEATRGLSDDGQKVYQISGRDIRSGLDDGIVYDKTEWGSDRNLISNSSFEENQVTPRSFHLAITATGGTYTLTDGTDTTSAINWNDDETVIQTRMETDLGNFTDVIVVQVATAPTTYLIQMVVPPFGSILGINVGSLTGGSATTVAVEEGGQSPSPWTKAQTLARGVPQGQGSYDEFVVSDNENHTPGGTYSLGIEPGPSDATSNRNLGAQQVVSVTPGAIVQASIWVYPTSGTDRYRLGLFGVGEEYIASNNISGISLTPNTWNQIVLTDVLIPDNVSQLIFRIQNANPGPWNPALFYVDDGSLFAGYAAETPGTIVEYLVAAAQARGTLEWLDTSSFSATTDSNSVAWPEDEAFSADRGQLLGSHVLAGFLALGYEFNIVPKASPVGSLTHDLKLYVPGGRDTTPNVGVFTGMFTGGSVTKRRPKATHVLVEDVNQNIVEVTDGSFTGVPRRESFIRAEFAGDAATADRVGAAALADNNKNLVALQAAVVPDDLVAWRDVHVGDTTAWTVLGDTGKHDRRISTVTVKLADGEWSQEFTASKMFAGEAAIWESFRILFAEFDRKQEIPSPAPFVAGGTGGPFTIQIAAYDATDISKARADFVCTGTNDELVIQAALDSFQFFGGTVWLSEGQYNLIVPSGGSAISLSGSKTLRGVSPQGTFITIDNSSDPGGAVLELTGSDIVLADFAIESFYSTSTIKRDGFLGDLRIENCEIRSDDGIAIELLNSFNTRIIDSRIDTSGDTEPAILLQNCNDIWITGNFITGGKNAVRMVDDGTSGLLNHDIQIKDNFILTSYEEAIYGDGGRNQISFLQIKDNFIQGAGFNLSSYVDTGAIHIIGDPTSGIDPYDPSTFSEPVLQISGNIIEDAFTLDGIRVVDCGLAQIHDNYLEDIGGNGIHADRSSGINVERNTIIWPQIDDTYDGIVLTGETTEPRVIGNRVVGASAAVSPLVWRYGINIASADVEDAVVVDNQLGPVANYGSDAINDAGTGTRLFWPADATYGDNWV